MFKMLNWFGNFIINRGNIPPQQIESNPVDVLPSEVIFKIFYELNSAELRTCLKVSKPWKVLASVEDLWNALMLKEIPFGKKKWATHFGDVGEEPPLPKDIIEILKSPCPFFAGKRVKDTHMLVLIPQTVDGKPLNFTTLEEFVKAPKEGCSTQYATIQGVFKNKYINQTIAESHWALMTMDVIPGSRDKKYVNQQALIAKLAKQTGMNYELPPLLEATICIFMHHVTSEKHLFPFEPLTYTRCQENIRDDHDRHIMVGGFSSDGLRILSHYDGEMAGVAALRKFF